MDGSLTWNQPSQLHRNYARAGFDRPHMLQMGFVYEMPFGRDSSNPVAQVVKDWQVSGIASWLSGRPFTIGGDNGLLQQQGGTQTINVVVMRSLASAKPVPTSSGMTRRCSRSRGTPGATPAATRSARRRTRTRCVAVPGDPDRRRYRLEMRVESQNVLNHPQWGIPVTGFTGSNFMRIRSLARPPRTVQFGLRLAF